MTGFSPKEGTARRIGEDDRAQRGASRPRPLVPDGFVMAMWSALVSIGIGLSLALLVALLMGDERSQFGTAVVERRLGDAMSVAGLQIAAVALAATAAVASWWAVRRSNGESNDGSH